MLRGGYGKTVHVFVHGRTSTKRELARETGLDERVIKKALKRLLKTETIVRASAPITSRTGGSTPTGYRVNRFGPEGDLKSSVKRRRSGYDF